MKSILQMIRCLMGSQCSSFITGAIWSNFLRLAIKRAALFCTFCNQSIMNFGPPYSSELQLSSLEVIREWTNITSCIIWLDFKIGYIYMTYRRAWVLLSIMIMILLYVSFASLTVISWFGFKDRQSKNTFQILKQLTNISSMLGFASTACHTGWQSRIKSSKPWSVLQPNINDPNPRQLVCMHEIRSISISSSPAEIIAKSTNTLSSCSSGMEFKLR